MKQNMVITISREYGTGGHDIGKRLAKLLDVPFYDKEIVEMTAERFHLDKESLDNMENNSKNPLPFGLGGLGTFEDSDDRMFIKQSQIILEVAKQPCVIIGRCADFILHDHPNRCSIFLYSGIKQRLAHIRKAGYHIEDAAKETEKMDRRRAAYYKYHTGQEWGRPANYHLCIDSSLLGAHTAEALAEFMQRVENEAIKDGKGKNDE